MTAPKWQVRIATSEALGRLGQGQADTIIDQGLARLQEKGKEGESEIVTTLAALWLAPMLQDVSQPIFPMLYDQLTSSNSRLNARYRGIIVGALARWYHAGLPRETSLTEPGNASQNPLFPERTDPRAQLEHAEVEKTLSNLCSTDHRLWLRSAACEAWVEATELLEATRR